MAVQRAQREAAALVQALGPFQSVNVVQPQPYHGQEGSTGTVIVAVTVVYALWASRGTQSGSLRP